MRLTTRRRATTAALTSAALVAMAGVGALLAVPAQAATGCTVADGELMLLHQGAAAFTLWTGQPAPLDLMQQKLAEARAGGVRSAEGEPTGAPADTPADAEAATTASAAD